MLTGYVEEKISFGFILLLSDKNLDLSKIYMHFRKDTSLSMKLITEDKPNQFERKH